MTHSCPVCGNALGTGDLYCSLCGVRRSAGEVAHVAAGTAESSSASSKIHDSEGLFRQVLFLLDNGRADEAWKYCRQAFSAGNNKDAELVMLEKALEELRQEGVLWARRPFRAHLSQAGLENSEESRMRLSRYAKRFEEVLVRRRQRKLELEKSKAAWQKLLFSRKRYQEAVRLMNEASSADDYHRAADMFGEIGDYAKAQALRRQCVYCAVRFREIIKARRRQFLAKCFAFFRRGSFLAFVAVITVVIAGIFIEINYRDKSGRLLKADDYISKGQYMKAAQVYEQHDDYASCLRLAQILQGEGKIKDALRVAEKAAAIARAECKNNKNDPFYADQEYDAVKTCLSIACLIGSQDAVNAYKRLCRRHPDVSRPNFDYDLRHIVAGALIQSGRFGEACYFLRRGDLLTFGKYEQDGNKDNGAEDIYWVIQGVSLNKDGVRLRLTALVALDIMPYNSVKTPVSWKTCSLRGWLNRTFYEQAFNKHEQAAILETSLKGEKNSFGQEAPWLDTLDKVWVLSVDEASSIFKNNDERLCLASKYAFSKNGDFGIKQIHSFVGYYGRGDVFTERTGVRYWLRTPGTNELKAAIVGRNGGMYYGRDNSKQIYDRVVTDELAVRPCLRIACTKSFLPPVTRQFGAKTAGQILNELKFYKTSSGRSEK